MPAALRGLLQNKNAMHMIWHDDKCIQFNLAKSFAEPPPSFLDGSLESLILKYKVATTANDREEISARLTVVEAGKTGVLSWLSRSSGYGET